MEHGKKKALMNPGRPKVLNDSPLPSQENRPEFREKRDLRTPYQPLCSHFSSPCMYACFVEVEWASLDLVSRGGRLVEHTSMALLASLSSWALVPQVVVPHRWWLVARTSR